MLQIRKKLFDGELYEYKHPLDMSATIIVKRIGDKVFVTCFVHESLDEVLSARITTYEDWKQSQKDYYGLCKDSDESMNSSNVNRHIDGDIFTTELI
tara:strand:- start:247 stop:537 length:291 start_codon:yes stop_codon:yes gene_type:complete